MSPISGAVELEAGQGLRPSASSIIRARRSGSASAGAIPGSHAQSHHRRGRGGGGGARTRWCFAWGKHFGHRRRGNDVADFQMSGGQDELVQAVLRANFQHRSCRLGRCWPVLMKPWLAAGESGGGPRSIPDRKAGRRWRRFSPAEINPSGKLPFSYIQERSERPNFAGYKDPGLKVNYSEGFCRLPLLTTGKKKSNPLFPFGHGLSYTTFQYKICASGNRPGCVRGGVRRKKHRPGCGAETAQLYVGPRIRPCRARCAS